MGEISNKMQERSLKWYGHVLRREEEYVGNRVMVMKVPVENKEGKTETDVVVCIKNDLSGERIVRGESAGPSSMEASHKTHRPHIQVGKGAEEEVIKTSFPQ